MHKGVVCCFVISALSLCSSVLAQQPEEKLTITTYYPSPTGIYNRLVAKTLGIGDVNGDGSININDAPDPETKPGQVYINGTVNIGNEHWPNPADFYKLYVDDSSQLKKAQIQLYNGFGGPSDLAQAGIAFTVHDYRGFGGIYAGQEQSGTYEFGRMDFYTRTSDTVGETSKLSILSNGNVGIGTNTPVEKLQVVGNITLGTNTTNQKYVVGGDENLRIIRGCVHGNGAIYNGQGFTCSYIDDGEYRINFNQTFSSIPSVTATLADSDAEFISIGDGEVGSVKVYTFQGHIPGGDDPSDYPDDEPFCFIAIGPR
ncbi:MAG: hypothetical protein PHE65_02870 [Candidatus Omnitrophica bacterium]|nr:hypothetical protein [Candidatus Omnitrophota bacterium]